jgi:hypothetical protein
MMLDKQEFRQLQLPLTDLITDISVKLENGRLDDAEMQARSLLERIKELNGNTDYGT